METQTKQATDHEDAERFRALERLLRHSCTRVVLTGGPASDLIATETDYDGEDQYIAVVEDAASLADALDAVRSGAAMEEINGTPEREDEDA
jgi:hypothetical protein